MIESTLRCVQKLIGFPLRCLATLGAVLAYGIVLALYDEKPWSLRAEVDAVWRVGRQR
jgi:hypothetical protein